jgi:hypothetical protein
MGLINLPDIKLYLSISTTDKDSLLNALIAECSAMIESYCNRTFRKTSYSESYDGNGGVELFLKQYPITEVTSLAVDDVAYFSVDYVIYADEGIVKLTDGSVFSKGSRNVEIVYKAGHEIVPHDVQLSCLKLVALAFKETDSDRIGIVSQNFGDQSTSFVTSEFPDDIRKILNPHKKVLI